ncbi:MAG: hypothetical protein HYZ37_16775 [Candidatus Solibacter usitatus]|nr:hypothetical protein [Candidatus Solibacter usitatus]
MRAHILAVTALLILTALGFAIFPGHTYLQSDTQIYIPILERIMDHSLFEKEIIARQPHVSYTIYDEAAIGLRKLTSLPFRDVLAGQQLLFRFCALLGAYLIAISLGLGRTRGVLIAAIFGLGATIAGPSVLTLEYEPVPRGSALGLTMLAVGLVAHGNLIWAGCAMGLAFLYHAPAVYPFLGAYVLLTLLPSRRHRLREHLTGLIPVAAAGLLLFALATAQPTEGERQVFFGRIEPELEKAMRARASYNWISMWASRAIWQYVLLYAASMLALWRLRDRVTQDFVTLARAMPFISLMSMPVSWLLLENAKWSLMTQLQPMRAVLFVTVFAVILSAAAGIVAAEAKRWAEALAWFLIALAPSVQTRTIQVLFELQNPVYQQAAYAASTLALLILAALWLRGWRKEGFIAVLAVALALPVLVPKLAKVVNYPRLHHPELDELSRWARENTPKDAVFLFPDAGRNLHPGIFRAESLRSLYADWKGGGQINYLREFLPVWLPRWQQTLEASFRGGDLGRYRQYGIDYIAMYRKTAVENQAPVYQNAKYAVYRVP